MKITIYTFMDSSLTLTEAQCKNKYICRLLTFSTCVCSTAAVLFLDFLKFMPWK